MLRDQTRRGSTRVRATKIQVFILSFYSYASRTFNRAMALGEDQNLEDGIDLGWIGCGRQVNEGVTIVNRWYSYLTLGRLYNRDWERQSSS